MKNPALLISLAIACTLSCAHTSSRPTVPVLVADLTTDQRSQDFARELGKLYVALRAASFEDYEAAMWDLQARWPSSVTGDATELKRRIAEEILMGAYVRGVDGTHFSRSLERIRALGFSK